ncbi:MAG TPA: hypothetical protein VE572_05075 [Nitrososphaeraceae archaeon]|nr:hypothetical protein [Nitrososphaeraceae archaeon]
MAQNPLHGTSFELSVMRVPYVNSTKASIIFVIHQEIGLKFATDSSQLSRLVQSSRTTFDRTDNTIVRFSLDNSRQRRQ